MCQVRGEKWGEAGRLGVVTQVSPAVCATGQEPENKPKITAQLLYFSVCMYTVCALRLPCTWSCTLVHVHVPSG